MRKKITLCGRGRADTLAEGFAKREIRMYKKRRAVARVDQAQRLGFPLFVKGACD